MFKPMLADSMSWPQDIDRLRFPLYASIKLDGIRCLLDPDKGPVSRSLKPIPNDHIREILEPWCEYALDGELIAVPYNPSFQKTASAVMTEEGYPDFVFWCFDSYKNMSHTFEARQNYIRNSVRVTGRHVVILEQNYILNEKELRTLYKTVIDDGGEEGLILRSPEGIYKSNRSTFKEQGMIKVKPVHEAEGRIVDVKPLMSNKNEATTDLLGYTERSSHKAGLVAQEQVGKFVLETEEWGQFSVGTGLTKDQRIKWWKDRYQYVRKDCNFLVSESWYQGQASLSII